MATRFSGEPEYLERTMGKQLVNFINCGCELSAPLFEIYKVELEPTLYWWQAQRPNSLSYLGS